MLRSDHKPNYKSITISFLATMVRYYDYGLFGMSAAILANNYLPASDEETRMLGFFAIFSASVILRPLGSIIFGRIGDKVGRVASVKIATILAASATISIGLIPSASEVGIWAGFFLTIARIIFLVSLAGEVDAIKIYMAEMVGKRRRYFASSLVTLSAQIGVLIAATLYHYSQNTDISEQFWRFNFIGGGVFGIIVFLMRNSLVESEIFLKAKNRVDLFDDLSLYQIVSKHRTRFIVAILANGMLGGIYHFLIIFLATFTGNVVGLLSPDAASAMNMKLIAIYGIASVASGAVADRSNYYFQTIAALLFSLIVIGAMIYEGAVAQGCFPFLHGMLVFSVPFAIIPTYIKIQSLFASKVRMRLCSLSHSLGSMIFSSTTPLFCSLLWKLSNLYSMVLSFFVLQLLILLFVILFLQKQDYANEFEN